MRVNSLCYEVLVPSGVASRLRSSPDSERKNPLTLYTIYYIDGAVGGGHLTPKLVGFLDPLDREFFEAFTTVPGVGFIKRSEEHTSELQSRPHLVCRLLLEKKKKR